MIKAKSYTLVMQMLKCATELNETKCQATALHKYTSGGPTPNRPAT